MDSSNTADGPDGYFSRKLDVPAALTFDDVLLKPRRSSVEPDDADTATSVSRNVDLNLPVLTAAMDTVTEAEMAIGMARNGGLGVIHRNMDIPEMVTQVEQVKRAGDYIVPREDVVTAAPDRPLSEADRMLEAAGVGGAPVVDDDDEVLGIISGTDIRPYLELDEDSTVRDAMTGSVITAEPDVTPGEALEMMYDHKVERIPVVDDEGRLTGIVTMKDILERREFEEAVRDDDGLFRVGVAIGVDDYDRAERADGAGADILFIDTAHAHNEAVIDFAADLRDTVDADIVVGNIATREAAEDLVDVADGLKVGVGPGSICTTRVVAGAGVPQLTAIAEVADVARDHDIPVIADGGIRYSGDAIKAIAAGADAVMVGSYLAGTDEAPGRVVTRDGTKYKQYRGMGSVGAVQDGDADRYNKEGDEGYVPEGVEAMTPYTGPLADELQQLVGGMRSGMGYVGAATIDAVKENAEFVRITRAGQTEGHPHDVTITAEAPNYRPDE
ncbi:MAG: IMP dehydrogenase [Candidatus Nanohaloarchaea archaeon]